MKTLRWRPPLLPRVHATVAITPRQADVLTGLCYGLSNAEIGRRLYITEDSVKTYTRRLYTRMGVRDRAGAVALACTGQVEITVETLGET